MRGILCRSGKEKRRKRKRKETNLIPEKRAADRFPFANIGLGSGLRSENDGEKRGWASVDSFRENIIRQWIAVSVIPLEERRRWSTRSSKSYIEAGNEKKQIWHMVGGCGADGMVLA